MLRDYQFPVYLCFDLKQVFPGWQQHTAVSQGLRNAVYIETRLRRHALYLNFPPSGCQGNSRQAGKPDNSYYGSQSALLLHGLIISVVE
jgi:hypothetical protein